LAHNNIESSLVIQAGGLNLAGSDLSELMRQFQQQQQQQTNVFPLLYHIFFETAPTPEAQQQSLAQVTLLSIDKNLAGGCSVICWSNSPTPITYTRPPLPLSFTVFESSLYRIGGFGVPFISWTDRYEYYILFDIRMDDNGRPPDILKVVNYFKTDAGFGRQHAQAGHYFLFGFSGTSLTEFKRKKREFFRANQSATFPSLKTFIPSYYLGINVHKVIPDDTREWSIKFMEEDGQLTNAQIETITGFGGIINILSYITNLLRLCGPSVARTQHVEDHAVLEQQIGRRLTVLIYCPKCHVNVQAHVIRAGKGSKLHCLTCKKSWC
jgi:hypothetical protein